MPNGYPLAPLVDAMASSTQGVKFNPPVLLTTTQGLKRKWGTPHFRDRLADRCNDTDGISRRLNRGNVAQPLSGR